MQLEALADSAEGCARDESYPFVLTSGEVLTVDARPVVRAIDRELRAGEALGAIARRFHNTVVEMIARTCARISELTGLTRVVLSGGVFANALIAAPAIEALRKFGMHAYAHERVPTNDRRLELGAARDRCSRGRHVGSGLTMCLTVPGTDRRARRARRRRDQRGERGAKHLLEYRHPEPSRVLPAYYAHGQVDGRKRLPVFEGAVP